MSEWKNLSSGAEGLRGVVIFVFLGLEIVERQWAKACKRILDPNMAKLRIYSTL